jgi:hypothetical protein
MLAVRYSLHETDSTWTLHEQDAPLLTPMGHPVATRHRPLAERILEGVRASNDQDELTPYSLQVWYLDFGRQVPVGHLRASVLSGLDRRWDVASNPPADPRLAEGLRRAYRFADGDCSDAALRARVGRLSRRAMMTVAVFSARFQSARLGLLTVDPDTDRERLAFGTCRQVGERRVGRSLVGDPRYLAPALGRRDAFCRDSCLPRVAAHPEDDVTLGLRRVPRNCAVRSLLEGVRFFASFPDE